MSYDRRLVLLSVKDDNLFVNELGMSMGSESRRAKLQECNSFILHLTICLAIRHLNNGKKE